MTNLTSLRLDLGGIVTSAGLQHITKLPLSTLIFRFPSNGTLRGFEETKATADTLAVLRNIKPVHLQQFSQPGFPKQLCESLEASKRYRTQVHVTGTQYEIELFNLPTAIAAAQQDTNL